MIQEQYVTAPGWTEWTLPESMIEDHDRANSLFIQPPMFPLVAILLLPY
jgi:hypothetical protein